MVLVDVAAGQSIYAEGLWGHPGKSWKGLLRPQAEGLRAIKFEHYQVLKVENTVKGKGDASAKERGKNLKIVVDWEPFNEEK